MVGQRIVQHIQPLLRKIGDVEHRHVKYRKVGVTIVICTIHIMYGDLVRRQTGEASFFHHRNGPNFPEEPDVSSVLVGSNRSVVSWITLDSARGRDKF